MKPTRVWTLLAAAALAGCQSVGAPDKEATLASAGFQRHDADTPAKLAKLQALPQYRLVFAQRKNGPVWLFADAQGCKCVWVGSTYARQTYEAMRSGQQAADVQNAEAQINDEAAQDFASAWGAEIPSF